MDKIPVDLQTENVIHARNPLKQKSGKQQCLPANYTSLHLKKVVEFIYCKLVRVIR